MLQSLHIKDFVLIESLDMDFDGGMIAVTGETGSGKSIFVDAINLLAGKRADYAKVRSGAAKAIIEGVFRGFPEQARQLLQEEDLLDGSEECLIRREISSAGKSRAFVNDTPVSLSLLSALAPYLIDVHSQHQNLLLKENQFQMQVLDSTLAERERLDEYRQAYNRYAQEKKKWEQLQEEIREAQEKDEFNRFRWQEIENFKMLAPSEEELEKEVRYRQHAQEIKEALEAADLALSGSHSVGQALSKAIRHLSQIENFHTAIPEWIERLSSLQIDLQDLSQEISTLNEETEPDPNRFQELLQCLNSLNGLLSKFHLASYQDLLQEKKRLQESMNKFADSELILSEQKKKLKQAQTELKVSAQKLSECRIRSAERISEEITRKLQQLEMPNVRFSVQVTSQKSPTPHGMDEVVFLFSAHRDMPLRPVAEIASGGEISRVMLSIKSLVTHREWLPTLVFDEVDTGISGVVAQRVGEILQQIGREKQIFVISHLPQIAACASSHYRIYKEEQESGTHTYIKRLDQEQRIREIARLQSGESITEVALAAAQALLEKR